MISTLTALGVVGLAIVSVGTLPAQPFRGCSILLIVLGTIYKLAVLQFRFHLGAATVTVELLRQINARIPKPDSPAKADPAASEVAKDNLSPHSGPLRD
jgi:hypothetical protein